MAQQEKDIITSLVVRHKDIRAFSIQMLQPFYLDLYSIGQKSGFPPESCITMTHLPPSVKGIGDESEHPQDQCGDDNTRPNKNCPDHKLNPGIME
jgi:hypothetical protein